MPPRVRRRRSRPAVSRSHADRPALDRLLRRVCRRGDLMARQSFIWTALPNGYTPDRAALRLSVMLSPRLDPQVPPGQTKKLSTFFPDWEDWPQTLAAARFDIRYGGQTIS